MYISILILIPIVLLLFVAGALLIISHYKGVKTMSLEIEIGELIKAIKENTAAILGTGTVKKQAATSKATKGTKAKSGAAQGELKTEAKVKLGQVLKKRGKAIAKIVLSNFKVAKFPEIKEGEGVWEKMIKLCDSAMTDKKLSGKPTEETDDLLDDGGSAAKELTIDDVKEPMQKVQNSKALGVEVVKNIFEDAGIKAFKELKTASQEKLTEVKDAAEAALKDAGVK